MQNIDAHKREKWFLPERLKDFSHTSFTSWIILCNVCENLQGFWESRRYGNNVYTRRLTQLFIGEDDDLVHLPCRYTTTTMSLWLSPDVVDLEFNKDVYETRKMHRRTWSRKFFSRYHEYKQMVPRGDSFQTSRLSVAQVTSWLRQAGSQ